MGGRKEGALERAFMDAELRVWPRPAGGWVDVLALDWARVVRVVFERARPLVDGMLSLSRTVLERARPEGMLSLSRAVLRVDIL